MSLLLSPAFAQDCVLPASAEGSHRGRALVAADLDGDGVRDVIATAPGFGDSVEGEVGDKGAVVILSGADGSTLTRAAKTAETDWGLGATVLAPGDTDGDGRVEVAFHADGLLHGLPAVDDVAAETGWTLPPRRPPRGRRSPYGLPPANTYTPSAEEPEYSENIRSPTLSPV